MMKHLKTVIRQIIEKRYFLTKEQAKAEKRKKRIKDSDRFLSGVAIQLMSPFIRIQENKIVFITSRGDYQCNARWICEEMIRRKLPVELVWVYRSKTDLEHNSFPPQVKLVLRNSYEMVRELCSAKVIVDNSANMAYTCYRKKRGQYLLQTWHGSLGIKRMDAGAIPDEEWITFTRREAKMTDYCLSNSTFENEVFRGSYWPETPILMTGHARNDILCRRDPGLRAKYRAELNQRYGLTDDQHICLFGPTFHGKSELTPNMIDFASVTAALQQRFGGEWIICTRVHYLTIRQFRKAGIVSGFVDVSDYPDIQDIMLCADAAITDYSSWICDYMLTQRPGFIYANDLDQYENERGFYYPLNTLPFPLARTNEELTKNILSFEEDKFAEDCCRFIQDKGCIDDGHASERIVDKIEELIGK